MLPFFFIINMIDDFIQFLQIERRYSSHTLISYRTDLVQFQEFLYNKDFVEVKRNDIRNWIVYLSNNGLTNKSISRKISTLKSFYKFLLKNKTITENPAFGISSPKVSSRLPEFVPEKDIGNQRILQEFDIRTKAIIEIFYQTGIRLSELINLKQNNVSRTEIKIIGKRNKERVVPISKQLHAILEEWNSYKLENFKSSEYFFVTNKGSKMYSQYVSRIVKNYLDRVTTLKKKSPHILRHTFATHMLNNGAEIESIKEILGHSSLSATQIYTHNSISKLKKVYKSTHPRG